MDLEVKRENHHLQLGFWNLGSLEKFDWPSKWVGFRQGMTGIPSGRKVVIYMHGDCEYFRLLFPPFLRELPGGPLVDTEE